MKALVRNAIGHGFDFEDIDNAVPMGREVLVNVQAARSCHTDLLFATHDIVPTPAVVGHEVAGIVTAVGPDVAQFRVGDHVVGSLAQSAVPTGRMNLVSRRISLREGNDGYAALKSGTPKRAVVTSF